MGEAKFTKGEWEIYADKIGVKDTTDTQSFGMIKEVCWIEDVFYSSEESKANAYIITAAPEMYEFIETYMGGHPEAERLLAKARGEACHN